MGRDIRERYNSPTTLHRYDNMINVPRPKQKRPMSLVNRAAQFSAFAALTGYGEIVKNTADKRTMDENDRHYEHIYNDTYDDM